MKHGLKDVAFYVKKAPWTLCYNFPLVRDMPLGAPALWDSSKLWISIIELWISMIWSWILSYVSMIQYECPWLIMDIHQWNMTILKCILDIHNWSFIRFWLPIVVYWPMGKHFFRRSTSSLYKPEFWTWNYSLCAKENPICQGNMP